MYLPMNSIGLRGIRFTWPAGPVTPNASGCLFPIRSPTT